MPYSLNSKILVAGDVLVQDMVDETIFLNLKNEQYYSLDDVGTRIWQVLTESNKIQSAINTLLDEFEVEEGQLQHDIKLIIDDLLEQGLVVVSDT